jgi:hypothetical protein
MDRERVEAALGRMLDALAAIEHERWSHWQRYMHDKGKLQADGSLLIPAELVQRWELQIATPYLALTEAEKESDRDQVRRYLRTIVEGLTSVSRP